MLCLSNSLCRQIDESWVWCAWVRRLRRWLWLDLPWCQWRGICLTLFYFGKNWKKMMTCKKEKTYFHCFRFCKIEQHTFTLLVFVIIYRIYLLQSKTDFQGETMLVKHMTNQSIFYSKYYIVLYTWCKALVWSRWWWLGFQRRCRGWTPHSRSGRWWTRSTSSHRWCPGRSRRMWRSWMACCRQQTEERESNCVYYMCISWVHYNLNLNFNKYVV